jgi:hypothetical protein
MHRLAPLALAAALTACASPSAGRPRGATGEAMLFQGSSASPAGALEAGRPMLLTRPLEAYLGRTIQVAAGTAGRPEPWTLRQVGTDHVILERSRSYRVVPLRRISEVGWTDLTGIDPTPRLTLTAE